LETLLERTGVLNDPIVDDRDISLAVDVRVRIALVRNTVRRPPGVAYSHVAGNRARSKCALELGDLSSSLAGFDPASVHHCNAGRVVAAVFHALEPLEQEGSRAAHSDVPNNSTHKMFWLTVLFPAQGLDRLTAVVDE